MAEQQLQVVQSTYYTSIIDATALQLNISTEDLVAGIKAQSFGSCADKVTDFHISTYLALKKEFGLNPLKAGELFGFPLKNGVLQIIPSLDLICKILYGRPEVIRYWVKANHDEKGNLVSATAYILTDRSPEPFEYEALLNEWRVSTSPSWQQRPQHMLGLRALKQCARYIDISLPPDKDEITMIDVGDAEVIEKAQPAKIAPARAAIPQLTKKKPDDNQKAEYRKLWHDAESATKGVADTVMLMPKPFIVAMQRKFVALLATMRDDLPKCYGAAYKATMDNVMDFVEALDEAAGNAIKERIGAGELQEVVYAEEALKAGVAL